MPAKELLHVPNDCSQKVSQYIAVCITSLLFSLGVDFLGPCRQSTCMAELLKDLCPQGEFRVV